MYRVKLPDTVNPQSNSYYTCIKSALHHTHNKDIFDAVSRLLHAPKSKLSPRPVCLKACFHDQVSQQAQEHQTAEALKTTAQKADFLLQNNVLSTGENNKSMWKQVYSQIFLHWALNIAHIFFIHFCG